jgi:hypothetical protein
MLVEFVIRLFPAHLTRPRGGITSDNATAQMIDEISFICSGALGGLS